MTLLLLLLTPAIAATPAAACMPWITIERPPSATRLKVMLSGYPANGERTLFYTEYVVSGDTNDLRVCDTPTSARIVWYEIEVQMLGPDAPARPWISGRIGERSKVFHINDPRGSFDLTVDFTPY